MSKKIENLNLSLAMKLFNGDINKDYVSNPGLVVMTMFNRINEEGIHTYSIRFESGRFTCMLRLGGKHLGTRLTRYTRLSQDVRTCNYQICSVINKVLDDWMKVKLGAVL